jgi:magnesium-transporting ATPase (P-type)
LKGSSRIAHSFSWHRTGAGQPENIGCRPQQRRGDSPARRIRSQPLEEVEQQHLLLRFAQEFTHFFAIILWIGAGLSFVAEYFDPGQGMARLGVAIVGVILINGVFSFWQEYKAERAVAALRQLLPQKVKALRTGEIAGLLASQLVPGDIVLLEEGDFVPADCRLTEVFGLRVNLSTVTGESLAKARTSSRAARSRHCRPRTLFSPAPRSFPGRRAPWSTQPACAPSSAASPT